MIKLVVKKFIKEDKVDEAINLYRELVEATSKEEGCIKYELYQDEKDPAILAIIEEWESKEALAKHTASEHFTRIVPMIAELTAKDSEMNTYKKLI
jgi:quinol monooxygenase YgiN